MKGIVITKMVIILAVLAVAAYLLLAQGGQLPSITSPAGTTAKTTTTIKSTEQASNQITEIGSGVENVGSILEDIDKSLG